MPSIQTYLQQILDAVYGEEVRGAIHDAIEECYTDVTTSATAADAAATAANAAATAANAAASAANSAAAFSKKHEKEVVFHDFVLTGGINSTSGEMLSGSDRLVSSFLTIAECFSIRAINGYSFCVYAWDETDTYIGAYQSDGSFGKGTVSVRTSFDLTKHPSSYQFRISVQSQNSDVPITLEDRVNVLFTGNSIRIDRTLAIEGAAADAKTVGSTFKRLADALDYNGILCSYYEPINGWEQRKYIDVGSVKIGSSVDVNGTSLSSYSCIKVPCQAGDRFRVSGSSGNGPRLWAFVDENYTLLQKSDAYINTQIELDAVADGYLISSALTNSSPSVERLTIDAPVFRSLENLFKTVGAPEQRRGKFVLAAEWVYPPIGSPDRTPLLMVYWKQPSQMFVSDTTLVIP